jgi:hypothetical protein
MRVTLFALAMLGAVLVVAPTADGFSSGSKGSRGSSGSSFSGTTGGGGSTVSTTNGGGGTTTAATPEPLAALAVGLGLLGARYLRRR